MRFCERIMFFPVVVLITVVVSHAGAALGQTLESSEIRMSEMGANTEAPRHHFRLRDPADRSPEEALALYDIVSSALQAGYARSGHAVAAMYQTWRRYNSVPYLSRAHGNHYLNNYANPIAKNYGAFEQAGKLPVGSIIAKDSFSVTESGEILLGSLFVMEKMPEGFNYVTGDWRYTQIQPEGVLFGETKGEGSDRVEYCIACHLAVEHQDHLYFIPEAVRVQSGE